MDLGIAQLSMNMAMANTQRSFGIGMIRASMDNVEQMGQMMADMMRQVPIPAGEPGSNVNILV